VRRPLKALLTLALLFPLLAHPSHAIASVTVDVPFQISATLDGRPLLISGAAQVSGTLCLPLLVYASPLERYAFEGWYVNATRISTGSCLSVSEGSYLAHYKPQFLVGLASDPPGLLSTSLWANASEPTPISLPTQIEREGVRARLIAAYFNGYPLPIINGSIVIGVRAPALITLAYEKFVRITIMGPNFTRELWARAGAPIALPLPDYVPVAEGARLRLVAAYAGQTEIGRTYIPGEPVLIAAAYVRQYYVRVSSPQGALVEGWYDEGTQLSISAPEMISMGPGRRLAFLGWSGINYTGSSLGLTVRAPINATALYELQVEVQLMTPLGTSSYWIGAGKTMALSLPTSLPASLGFVRSLVGVTMNGKSLPVDKGIIMVTPLEPSMVVAQYSLSLDPQGLLILAGIGLLISALYLGLSRAKKREKPD